ncbi:MAG: chlorite dismutase family protein [Nitrospinota bacterium]
MEKTKGDTKTVRPQHGGHSEGHPGGGSTASADIKELVDISEKGARSKDGRLTLDNRLFMQFLAFTNVRDSAPIVRALRESGMESVLYENLNDPDGVALLTMSENPDFFITTVRDFIKKGPLSDAELLPEYTMFGRTYSLGYEDDLEYLLLKRSRQYSKNPEWPWVVWYPLRRTGEFAQLPAREQGLILREHGMIGRAFGEAGLAHDVRLSCFGLDKNDNDFVIGLIGSELYPLSMIVQTMRKTVQTSTYIEKLGPFFVGKAVWQSPDDVR